MPYSVKKQNCKQSSGKKGTHIVIKKSTNEKSSCHASKEKAKDSIAARHGSATAKESIEDIVQEIKDYFRNQQDEDYLAFDGHPLSDVESLMDPDKPAPWDHLTNHKDDEDLDIKIRNNKK
jgi:hypothetical protein